MFLTCLFVVGEDADNLGLNIAKSGSLSDVVITWVTGLSPSESQPDIANGSITPSTGSVMMMSNQSLATFTLTVSSYHLTHWLNWSL